MPHPPLLVQREQLHQERAQQLARGGVLAERRDALGFSALAVGLAFLPCAAGVALGSLLGGRLLVRLGARALITCGHLVSACGMVLLCRIGTQGNYWGEVFPALLVLSLGIGPALVAASVTALRGVAARDSEVAGAVYNVCSELGGALGAALLATIVTAVTAHGLALYHPAPEAAVDGYRTAFAFSAALLTAAALLAGALIRGRRR